ncbi:acrylyl-CoA reductase family protein [Kordia jejudonensis]|uniref:acrylyl-CoA reductase family protein n=1 Tax=Kordia jejudonensis TaxID=1348245 RepID=UPI0006295334|nr:acryloyl-CoA reductase [Kordia jejudonensis]
MEAIVIEKEQDKAVPRFKSIDELTLPKGDVLVKVNYSALNYSDATTMFNVWDTIDCYPHIPGIDFVGEVISSSSESFTKGERVLHTSYGVGYNRFGGLAQKAVSNDDWLIKVPDDVSDIQAMGLGTVGFTAMLAINELEANGLIQDDGKVLVTGATGGVGSLSIQLLSRLGYNVVASTGKLDSYAQYLKSIGASEVIDRIIFKEKTQEILEDENYAGFIDSVGGITLSRAIKQLQYEGIGITTGFVTGNDLDVSLAPFVQRGIKLIGINSVYTVKEKRESTWYRLFKLINFDILEKSIRVEPIEKVPELARNMLDGHSVGRIVVRI